MQLKARSTIQPNDEQRPVRPRLITAILVMVMVYALGTIGYYTLSQIYLDAGAQWSLSECLYMTVISITTVGYGEVIDIHAIPVGRAFTSFIILLGTGVEVYAVSVLTTFLVEGHLLQFGRLYKMRKEVRFMDGHIVVCGAGRVGQHVAHELAETGHSFSAIDLNADRLELLMPLKRFGVKVAGIKGDASDEEALLKAGIERASGLIITLPADKETLFVVMAARELNPNLHVVASAEDEKTVALLRRAGANRIVPTKAVGGLRLASEAIRPNVVDFLDMMRASVGGAVRFAEAVISPGSALDGQSLARVREGRDDPGVSVVAIRQAEGEEYTYGPAESTRLSEGDTLILVGERAGVSRVRKLAASR